MSTAIRVSTDSADVEAARERIRQRYPGISEEILEDLYVTVCFESKVGRKTPAGDHNQT